MAPIDVAGLHFEIDDATHPEFWARIRAGQWEPTTVAALGELLGPSTCYVDVGSWIGPTVLMAAALGAEVHAFEPDPVALEGLDRNLALNPGLAARVTVHRYAVGARAGRRDVVSAEGLGASTSSTVRRKGDRTAVDVRSPASDDHLAQLFRRADVVKVDIEGGEYSLLPTLVPLLNDGVTVLLSTHVYHRRDLLPRRLPDGLVRGPHALLALEQLRAVLALRRFSHWAVADKRTARWQHHDRRGVVRRLVAEPRGHDLLVSDRPLPIGAG